MELGVTVGVLAAGAALTGFCRWYEGRPRELGVPRLVPSTLLMALGVLAMILAAAHLVTLLTGRPLVGRVHV